MSGRRRSAPDGGGALSALLLLAAMVAVMWIVELADGPLDGRLDQLGIEPKRIDGLLGIPFAPFLHTGVSHLATNTVPLLILGSIIAVSGLRVFTFVTVTTGLLAGLGTWATADEGTIHIGASGIVFGYASYLMVRGLYTRRALDLLVGVIVIAVYGATMLVSFEARPGISWQGHLFGAMGGVLAAALIDRDQERRAARPPAR